MSYIIRGHFYTWGPNSVWDILSCCRWHLVMWSWFIICHCWSKLSSKRAHNQYDKWAFLHFRTFSPAAADTQLSGLDWCPPSHFHQHPFSSLIQIGGWLCHVRDGDIGKTLNKSMCKCYHENSFAIGFATFLDYSVKGGRLRNQFINQLNSTS